MKIDLSLRWCGPLRNPNLLDGIQRLPKDVYSPHVYLYVQEYPTPRNSVYTAVYVGQASNLVKRLLEHLHGVLGLQYWPRDGEGRYIHGDVTASEFRRLNYIDQLDQFSAIAVEEIKRLSFFVAQCPSNKLSSVEAALIDWVMSRAKNNPQLECTNSRQERHGSDGPLLEIGLETDGSYPEAQSYLDLAFGTSSITWGARSE